MLLQLLGLSRRVREFNDELVLADLGSKSRRRERRRLDTFIIVQMLGGPWEERMQLTGKLHKAISLITLVIAPVLLLLVIQLQFLPYQYELLTWMHRIALGIDLGLLWIFWPAIKSGGWAPWRGTPVGAALVSSIMFFACAIATFPGEIADGGARARDWKNIDDSYLWSVKEVLFGALEHGGLSTVGRYSNPQRYLPFSRALEFSDKVTLIDLDEYHKIRRRHRDNKDRLEPWQEGRSLSLRGRTLRGALFNRSDLRGVDFYNANLQGASLEAANLEGALFENAKLQGASFYLANLQGASFNYAELQDTALESANLQGASVAGAKLLGASLQNANLHGASLVQTELTGAALQGARFDGASLQDADLTNAELDGAVFLGADTSRTKPEVALPIDASNSSGVDHLQVLADHLTQLACTEKHTAQGLIRDPSESLGFISGPSQPRLEAIGDEYLPDVARALLAAVEKKASNCLGVQGLNAQSIAKLRTWAEEPRFNWAAEQKFGLPPPPLMDDAQDSIRER